jgi:hypothetical protein
MIKIRMTKRGRMHRGLNAACGDSKVLLESSWTRQSIRPTKEINREGAKSAKKIKQDTAAAG